MSASPSLRERSKVRRRLAIQHAAIRLFTSHGYDGTTIAEIADEAEVAPRTVSMYFPTKLDIALSTSDEMAERLTAIFQQNPAMPFTDVVDRWIADAGGSADPELMAMTAAMMQANPNLRAASTTNLAEAARVGRPALLAETGLSADDPMVRVVNAAVGAAIAEYFAGAGEAMASVGGRESFVRYLRTVVTAARPV